MVKGLEKYLILKELVVNVFNDINSMIVRKIILIIGKSFNIELFLGGEYKFILIMLGLKGVILY